MSTRQQAKSIRTEDSVHISWQSRGGLMRLPVCRVEKRRLRVKTTAYDPQWLPRVGGALPEAQVERPACPPSGIDLTLTAIEMAADGSFEIELSATGERAAALIWLLNRTPSGEEAATACRPDQIARVPGRGIYTEQARIDRHEFIEEQTGESYPTIHSRTFQPDALTSNIENLVGSVEIPVGLAGPLHFRGNHAKGTFYAPMGTTEGALVASASRGARLLSAAGGVSTAVLSQRMMRAPLFLCENLSAARFLVDWIASHHEELQEKVREVSQHACLTKTEPVMMGRMVHVNFIYETGDAAGQNMTTTTTWHTCQWILQLLREQFDFEVENFVIEANVSGDKKVNYRSFISGRGIRVLAEARIPNDVLRQVMKVEPHQLMTVYHGMTTGSIQSGLIGMNINIANVIAAIFGPTGQDLACVHESSIGQLQMDQDENGIHCSMLLPSLIVGTVGGGTGLPNQQEYLKMLGCAGPANAAKLAEIIAGFCLSLDLSTLSAIANGTFALAHEKLGRNRPIDWLKSEDLNLALLQKIVRPAPGDHLTAVEQNPASITGSSIITELTSRKARKFIGHKFVDLTIENNQQQYILPAVVKSKPLDREVLVMLQSIAALCSPKLASLFQECRDVLGFCNCHENEIRIYEMADERLTSITPQIYGTMADPNREAWLVVMERFAGLLCPDDADTAGTWQRDEVRAAIRGIAGFHSIHYGRDLSGDELAWCTTHAPDARSMAGTREFWSVLWEACHGEFPDLIDRQTLATAGEIIGNFEGLWQEITQLPRTIVHNDFNPRNAAIRERDGEPGLFCYDWELATVHLPQHDLVEFLAFTLKPEWDRSEIDSIIELHRETLAGQSSVTICPAQWHRGFVLALEDFFVNRMGLYLMSHVSRNYEFMDRLVRSTSRLLSLYRAPSAGEQPHG